MEEFQEIPLTTIRPNPFNPRKRFSGPDFDELVASIKTIGILQPVLCRPVKSKKTPYEIVFGGRRFAASCTIAKANGGMEKGTILARVKPLSDDQALDMMTIENLQRDDLTPLEEARGFKLYVDRRGKDAITDLAERTSIDARYIRRRLLILDLPKKTLDLWDKGKLSFGHLMQLSRLKGQMAINQAAQNAVQWNDTVARLKARIDDAAPSLKNARFDIEKAGCPRCKYNSDVQKQLFDLAGQATTCTDTGCFKRHMAAYLKANWKKTGWYRKHKTTGFIFGCDYRDVYKYGHNKPCHIIYDYEKISIEKCRTCENFVSIVELNGEGRQARACLGSSQCLDQQKAKARTAGKSAQKTPPKDPDQPRVEWHGNHFRQEFFKEQLPIAFEKVRDDLKINQLVLFNLVRKHDDIHKWYATRHGLASAKKMDGWFRLGGTEIFDHVSTLESDAVLAEITAVTIRIATLPDEYYSEIRDRVAVHMGIDISKEFSITKEYLLKKTKSEMLAMGEELNILQDPAAKAFLFEKLLKKRGKYNTCKKGELIRVFLESGVDLKGRVPAEIFNGMDKQ